MGNTKRAFASLLACLSLTAFAHGQNLLKDYVLAGDSAIGIKSPIPIGAPGVQSAEWSSDGRYVLLTSLRHLGEGPLLGGPGRLLFFDPHEDSQLAVSLWDARAKETRDLLTVPANSWACDQKMWLIGINVGLVVMKHREIDPRSGRETWSEVLYQINAEGHDLHEVISVATFNGTQAIEVAPSPTSPVALVKVIEMDVQGGGPDRAKVIQLDPRSDTWSEIVSRDLLGSSFDWSPDGKTAYGTTILRQGPNHKATLKQFELSFADGTLRPLEGRPKTFHQAGDTHPLRLAWSAGNSTSAGVTAKFKCLWLSGNPGDDPHQVLLSADVDGDAAISPERDMVLYVSNGMACARPLVTLPRVDFVQARKTAEQNDAMFRAKLVTVAYQLYAADYGGQTPALNEDYVYSLSPYVKDPDVLVNLVLTWQGNVNTLAEPAKTVIGYIPTANGKAVLYADTHVVWQEKP